MVEALNVIILSITPSFLFFRSPFFPFHFLSSPSPLLSLSLCGPDDWKVVMCREGGIEDMLTLKDMDLKKKAADILVLLLSEG